MFWFFFSVRTLITFPNSSRLLFICMVSSLLFLYFSFTWSGLKKEVQVEVWSCCSTSFSEPARSASVNVGVSVLQAVGTSWCKIGSTSKIYSWISNWAWKMQWDRELWWLSLVWAVSRCCKPMAMQFESSYMSWQTCSCTPCKICLFEK